ncbi:hypothetical protein B0H17DRAFT_1257989, partial [Mycena rosella]
TVRLTLTREWDRSIIYPVAPAKRTPAGGESIQWDVRTHRDGSITEHTTGLDVAYLFWEAHSNPGVPLSPPSSPVLDRPPPLEAFSPTTCNVPYGLGPPVCGQYHAVPRQRTACARPPHRGAHLVHNILAPSLAQAHACRARLVPQDAYEVAARLDITPAPDVVTRVFMLFKGVSGEYADAWSTSTRIENPERWRAVVDVDVEHAQDPSLFRVLEWGGMEVL